MKLLSEKKQKILEDISYLKGMVCALQFVTDTHIGDALEVVEERIRCLYDEIEGAD